jgi:hypothetical protein
VEPPIQPKGMSFAEFAIPAHEYVGRRSIALQRLLVAIHVFSCLAGFDKRNGLSVAELRPALMLGVTCRSAEISNQREAIARDISCRLTRTDRLDSFLSEATSILIGILPSRCLGQ